MGKKSNIMAFDKDNTGNSVDFIDNSKEKTIFLKVYLVKSIYGLIVKYRQDRGLQNDQEFIRTACYEKLLRDGYIKAPVPIQVAKSQL